MHYPKPLNEQPALQAIYQDTQEYPHAQAAAARVLSLPFHPYLTEQNVTQLADELLGLLSRQSVNC